MNDVKTAVITQIDAVITGCLRRRLGKIEVNPDGSQRMLSGGLKFGDFATAIQVIDGVVSFQFVSPCNIGDCVIAATCHHRTTNDSCLFTL